MTWAMIRVLRQPNALSVPNSRTRRVTAATVSRLATATAVASTRTDSQRPRSSASFAVLDREPVTWLARLAEVVTVALGIRREISFATAGTTAALAAAT